MTEPRTIEQSCEAGEKAGMMPEGRVIEQRDGLTHVITQLSDAIAKSEEDAEQCKLYFGYFETSQGKL